MPVGPRKIQLALQGGGAKFVALIAVLEAVQKLEENKVLKVTRLACTSAGALTGCLFAAGIKMSELRTSLSEGEARRVILSLPKLNGARFLWKISSGRIYWDTSNIEQYLSGLFLKQQMQALDSLNVPVTVMSTDLGGRCKRIVPSGMRIADAIMESCGLPFCFRLWDRNGAPVFVDGGLCENLPSGELHDSEEDGPVVAVSFETIPGTHPKNWKDFSFALLDSAISNSVARARNALPDGSVCLIPHRYCVGTFEFENALAEGLKDKYELVYNFAEAYFKKLAASLSEGKKEARADPWVESSVAMQTMLRSAWEIYAAYEDSLVAYVVCAIELQLNSLKSGGGPDRMIARFQFRPADKPVRCLRVVAVEPIGKEYLGRTYWSVKNEKGLEIKTTALPARDPANPEERLLLLFFSTPLLPGDGLHTLFVRDYSPCILDELADRGTDALEYWPLRPFGPVGRIEFAFCVPEEHHLKIEPYENNSSKGKKMEPPDLATYSQAGDDGRAWFGWVGENLTRMFGVTITLENPKP